MEKESGLLLMKNKVDAVEYHLYDSDKIVSVDINRMLDRYVDKKIHIKIKNNEVDVVAEGVLTKNNINKGDKYYVGNLDIEEILFATTELFTAIVIDEVDGNEKKKIK